MPAELTLRNWLLAEIPQSKSQARCQRVYISWLAFRRNPVAVIGLLIIASLVAVATLAPWITASDGLDLHLCIKSRNGVRSDFIEWGLAYHIKPH